MRWLVIFRRAPALKSRSTSRHKRPPLRRLRRADLPSDTVGLARFLLGTLLVWSGESERLVARVVETEAYLPRIDAASHAHRGETARNRSMFLRRGHAYIYFIYGSAYCLNVTSEAPGVGAAVLLRAAEPLEGLETMRRRRPAAKRDADLLRGPGNLAAAFGLDRRLDGEDMCAPGAPLFLAVGSPPAAVHESVRIGISRDAGRMLRFFEAGNPHVSGPRGPRRRGAPAPS